jgi:hypothetical protein
MTYPTNPREVTVSDTQTELKPSPTQPNGTAAPAAGGPVDDVITIHRRTVDTLLILAGVVVAAVLVVAGALLTWGSNFAEDYVGDELTAQNIFFPDQAALEEDGRSDLVKYAGEQVTTGAEAEAYASFIDGHLADIAEGAEAQESGADEATVAELQATADEISGQRQSLFRGETLRGLLLSTFAWSTIGRIAGIAAIVAFVAAAVMIVLVVLGLIHRRRTATT